MNKQEPDISVIIPVKNEAQKIASCIEAILSQTVSVKEILVIDSGSTDNTLEILAKYRKVRVIQIAPSEFNHGDTRNLGIHQSDSEFLVYTVGDAVAADNEWIAKMLSGFTDENIAGVCGQQIVPHDPDKNPVEWFRPVSQASVVKYYFQNQAEFQSLTPQEKRRICGWDDVTAMYRRRVLLQVPFQRTTFAEDALWAKDALLAGFAIVYHSGARVFHYHMEDTDFTLKRTFTVFYYQYKYFGLIPSVQKQTIKELLSKIKLLLSEHRIPWNRKWYWYKYNRSVFSSIQQAAIQFRQALSKGEENLDKVHSQLCGIAPTPKKK